MTEQIEAPAEDRTRFDADARSAARRDRVIVVDSVEYKPKRRTGKVVKALLEAVPAIDKDADQTDPQVQMKSIDTLYQQVSLLLEDENGNNPDEDKLQEVMEIDDARDLMGWLVPQGDEAPAAGGDGSDPTKDAQG